MDLLSYLLAKDNGGGGGGGTSINGQLVNTTVGTTTVAKGDFLTRSGSLETPLHQVTESEIAGTDGWQNLPNICTDDNNYASASNYQQLFVKFKTPEQLGISGNTKIINATVNIKHMRMQYSTDLSPRLYKAAYLMDSSSPDVGYVNLYGTSYILFANTSSDYERVKTTTVDFTDVINTSYNLYNKGIYGIYINTIQSTNFRVYSINYTLTYETDGIVKTITSNADDIIGVANEDGSPGDTIKMYIPNNS